MQKQTSLLLKHHYLQHFFRDQPVASVVSPTFQYLIDVFESQCLPFMFLPFWGGQIRLRSGKSDDSPPLRKNAFFKTVLLVRKTDHLPPPFITLQHFVCISIVSFFRNFDWMQDSLSDLMPERESGTWRFPVWGLEALFRFCTFLPWGVKVLETWERRRIHLGQSGLEAQNIDYNVRGVAKRKTG